MKMLPVDAIFTFSRKILMLVQNLSMNTSLFTSFDNCVTLVHAWDNESKTKA